ncbi:hypothetical protein EYZ11_012627 [Aspergillus tanneri]|uniref:Uncharacterized protein n=1 Tax=Aspergillus tanneri TaxID=1220188 RepID=A0A4S3J1W1_9EURO|nr:hypothetical protein EYZ11_012627 [Aspergillus tanneri]
MQNSTVREELYELDGKLDLLSELVSFLKTINPNSDVQPPRKCDFKLYMRDKEDKLEGIEWNISQTPNKETVKLTPNYTLKTDIFHGPIRIMLPDNMGEMLELLPVQETSIEGVLGVICERYRVLNSRIGGAIHIGDLVMFEKLKYVCPGTWQVELTQ